MQVIERIPAGTACCWLLRGETGSVLIDAGMEHAEKILKQARDAGVRLLLLTHAHFDHITNAAFLARELGIPVALHPADLPLLKNQFSRPLDAQGVRGRVLRYFSQKLMQKPLEPFSPEIQLSDGMHLDTYGVDACVVALPGHTAGSVGVAVGDAIVVGDAMMRMPTLSPPLIFEDRQASLESASRIRESGAKLLLTSHGFTTCRRFFV